MKRGPAFLTVSSKAPELPMTDTLQHGTKTRAAEPAGLLMLLRLFKAAHGVSEVECLTDRSCLPNTAAEMSSPEPDRVQAGQQ